MGDNRNLSARRSHYEFTRGFIPIKERGAGSRLHGDLALEHMRIIFSCAFYNIPKPVEGVEDSSSSNSTSWRRQWLIFWEAAALEVVLARGGPLRSRAAVPVWAAVWFVPRFRG